MTNANTILYLDTRALNGERVAQINAALDLGLKVLIATPTPDAFKSFGCVDIIKTNLGDYALAEKNIVNYVREHRVKLSGVVAWKDLEVELASRLSHVFGFPGTSPEAAINVRDKARTRRILDQIPDANPRYAIVHNEEEFIAGLKRVGHPAMLKPAGNSGSRGIFLVDGERDPLEIYREFRSYNDATKGDMFKLYGDHALLEQVVIGSEHSVSGLVADGRVTINAIVDKTFDRKIPIQYENVTPSLLLTDMQTKLCDMVRASVIATGINWCGFHADVMITKDGPKILEIGGRLGGEFINSHLVPCSISGFSPYRTLLDIVRGIVPKDFKDRIGSATSRAGQRVVMPEKVGTVVRADGFEKVWNHPETRFVQVIAGPGAQMHLPKDRFKAYEIAYIVAQCSLNDDISKVLKRLADDITVVTS